MHTKVYKLVFIISNLKDCKRPNSINVVREIVELINECKNIRAHGLVNDSDSEEE